MPLYTSYLGFFNRTEVSLRNRCDGLEEIWVNRGCHLPFDVMTVERVFVMRNRGNSPVEPPKMVLLLWKDKAIAWKGYRDAYIASLHNDASLSWMQTIANKARKGNVVLICFERNPTFCHRRLLAEYIQTHYEVDYRGELLL